jgi:hypothetical protein
MIMEFIEIAVKVCWFASVFFFVAIAYLSRHPHRRTALWVGRGFSAFLFVMAIPGTFYLVCVPFEGIVALAMLSPALAIILIPYIVAVRANMKAKRNGETPAFDTWMLKPFGWWLIEDRLLSVFKVSLVFLACPGYLFSTSWVSAWIFFGF